jgi:hypothetical protein
MVIMNQEDIEIALADALQEEIEKEILLDLRCKELVSQGWTLVTLGDNAITNNMGLWMQENIHGDWRAFYNGRWVFENNEDAVLFTMRWAS